MISQNLPVASERSESVEESVPLFRLCLSGKLLWRQAESVFDIWLDEGIDYGYRLFERLAGNKGIKWAVDMSIAGTIKG